MGTEDKSLKFALQSSSKDEPLTYFSFPASVDVAQLDTEKIKTLFELQEREKNADFQRRLELLLREHELRLQESELENKTKKLNQELLVSTIQSGYKIVISAASVIAGVILAAKGQREIGFFLLGGGMSAVTANTVSIMKAARGRQS
jgi:hypothetical protein